MDVIADMLAAIVNAQRVGSERIVLPYSTHKEALANFLQQKGTLAHVRVQEGNKSKLILTLAYEDDGDPKVSSIRRLSTPGRRLYAKTSALPYMGGRPGYFVVSTSNGMMDETEARAAKLGGELICEVREA